MARLHRSSSLSSMLSILMIRVPRARSLRTSATILAIILAAGFLAGCGSSTDPNSAIAAVNEQNIQRLANLYFAYQMKHEWHGPPDEQAFKQFLRGYNPEKLTRIGIDPNGIDKLFVSERDGEPFKIRFGVLGSAMGSSEPVIFEAKGVGGRRNVGFLNMVQREVDDAQYNDHWAGRMPPAANPREIPRER
jgi:hypothetical protein